MCDWPVGLRRCGFDGIHDLGPLSVCPRHLSMLVTGALEAARKEARFMIRDGRRTPGGIEEEMRAVFAAIANERMAAIHRSEERSPCVYFAAREGYVKIGSTIDLAARIRTIAAGASMLQGMTAGPVTLLATMPGGFKEEKALHKRFSHLRVDPGREWFVYAGKLRDFVEGLQSVP
jgi:Meiotically up-regulated gene 113